MVILDFSCPPNFTWKQWLNLFVLTPQYLLNMSNIPHMLSLVSLIFYLLIVSLCPDSNWPSNLKSSKRDLLRCKCSLGSADPEVLYWLPLGKHTLSSLAQMPKFLPFLATTSSGSSLLHIVLKPWSLHIPDCSIGFLDSCLWMNVSLTRVHDSFLFSWWTLQFSRSVSMYFFRTVSESVIERPFNSLQHTL